ncbi:Sec-independent protein translocase protein TatB [Leucothrix arctica]|uniref:Twin-arginine translocase subunit TatB n=1 Tax=Leucothrix arctica TaxID=1481894 RepID=A0A317CEH2_9GAMM|nr:Sec-independent protein translocase protein TatB [Leucothrix arctica]PWQ95733.1 twin-arginine translocase subunit TatB [Leucothrix arctica]
MFDMSGLEMLLVGVIALLVIGPERLPGVAKTIGTWVGKAKAFINTTKADLEREINASEMRDLLANQKKEIDELRTMVDETKKDFTDQANELKDDFNSGIQNAADAMKPEKAKHDE